MIKKVVAASLVVVPLIVACSSSDSTKENTPSSTSEQSPKSQVADTRCQVPMPAEKSGYTTMFVHFTCEDDPMPASPRPVPRQVPAARANVRGALDELLKGPSEAERVAGFQSSFSSKTAGMINTVSEDQNRAIVDFKDFSAASPNASTTAGAGQMLRELNMTVFQFKSIHEAEYSFDGSCNAFWKWLQGNCQVVRSSAIR